jgi:hypothetical protein
LITASPNNLKLSRMDQLSSRAVQVKIRGTCCGFSVRSMMDKSVVRVVLHTELPSTRLRESCNELVSRLGRARKQ